MDGQSSPSEDTYLRRDRMGNLDHQRSLAAIDGQASPSEDSSGVRFDPQMQEYGNLYRSSHSGHDGT